MPAAEMQVLLELMRNAPGVIKYYPPGQMVYFEKTTV
jgi:hypothetical protein